MSKLLLVPDRSSNAGYRHTDKKATIDTSILAVEVSEQLRAAEEIEDLDRLMQRAKLLMTLDYRKKTTVVEKQQMDTMEALKEWVTALTEQVAALTTTTQRSHQSASLLCFQCNQPRHMQQNCLNKSRCCYVYRRNGHIASECRLENKDGAPQLGMGCPQRQ